LASGGSARRVTNTSQIIVAVATFVIRRYTLSLPSFFVRDVYRSLYACTPIHIIYYYEQRISVYTRLFTHFRTLIAKHDVRDHRNHVLKESRNLFAWKSIRFRPIGNEIFRVSITSSVLENYVGNFLNIFRKYVLVMFLFIMKTFEITLN